MVLQPLSTHKPSAGFRSTFCGSVNDAQGAAIKEEYLVLILYSLLTSLEQVDTQYKYEILSDGVFFSCTSKVKCEGRVSNEVPAAAGSLGNILT